MKILLTFVGNQDPFSDKTKQEGAILTIVQQLKPDYIYLFPSARLPGNSSETETNAEETKEWLINFFNSNSNNIFIRPLSLSDPRRIPDILDQGSREIKYILNSVSSENTEIIINVSSGTPQMQSCWYIWANSGLFAPCKVSLYQVGNPVYVAEDKRVEKVDFEFMEENNTIERIRKYLTASLFQAAAEEAEKLTQISCYSHRRFNAEIVKTVCLSYHHWDLLNYREASSQLKKIIARLDNVHDLQNFINSVKNQIETLEQLTNSDNEDIYGLTDIYYNAQRHFYQNAYADTLARIWRLIEGCLYYRLRNKYGVEPRDIGSSKNKDNMKKVLNGVQVFKELSFSKSASALKNALADTGYIAFEKKEVELPWGAGTRKQKIESAMEDIRKIRNESIVAHGIKPVSREVAQLSLSVGRHFLEFTFNNADFVENYPFKGNESVDIVKELLY